MKLERFYGAVGPVYLGHTAPEVVAGRLGINPGRFALYARFCEIHRSEVLAGIYQLTPTAFSAKRYVEISRAYFQAHPTVHWDLNQNAEAFPAFLAQHPGVPPWVPELADLEWWQFRTFVAPDEKPRKRVRDALHGSVMVRPYAHDVVTALHQDRVRPAPPATPVVALLWRDAQLEDHVTHASAEELVVIKAVVERVELNRAADAAGFSAAAVKQARTRLCKQGVLVPGEGTAR